MAYKSSILTEKELSHPMVSISAFFFVAQGNEPSISPCLVPWALLTWDRVLGLLISVNHVLLGGRAGSRRKIVMRNVLS